MKLHSIAAAAALAFVGSANALTPAQIDAARAAGTLKEVFVSGASALRLSFGAYIQEICNAGQGGGLNNFDVFFNSGATPGNNFRAYSCTLRVAQGNWAAGTSLLVVKRDSGGSVAGVGPVAGAGTAIGRMTVDGTCTATGSPSPATDFLVQGYNCPNTTNVIPQIGLSAGLSRTMPFERRDLP